MILSIQTIHQKRLGRVIEEHCFDNKSLHIICSDQTENLPKILFYFRHDVSAHHINTQCCTHCGYSLWVLTVDTHGGYSLWVLTVGTHCGYSLWVLTVGTHCGYSLWVLTVGTHCGYSLWVLTVGTHCGYSRWVLTVGTHCGYSRWVLTVGTHCGYSLWVLTVGTHCGYSRWVLTVVAGAEYYSELPTVENKHLYEYEYGSDTGDIIETNVDDNGFTVGLAHPIVFFGRSYSSLIVSNSHPHC